MQSYNGIRNDPGRVFLVNLAQDQVKLNRFGKSRVHQGLAFLQIDPLMSQGDRFIQGSLAIADGKAIMQWAYP